MPIILSLFILMFSSLVFAQPQQVCLIISDLTTEKTLQEEGDCKTRVTPASTFKIPLALMGFDSGILKSFTAPEWPYLEKYNASFDLHKTAQNPTGWIKNSAVWYSQKFTQQLGEKRLKDYVQKFAYGNQDVSGDPGKNNGLTQSWLTSSLKISPEEQIVFLRKLLENQLPVSLDTQTSTRELLYVETLPNGWKIYGKTGGAWERNANGVKDPALQLGWFVGWAVKDQQTLLFAELLRNNDTKNFNIGPAARAEVLRIFREKAN